MCQDVGVSDLHTHSSAGSRTKMTLEDTLRQIHALSRADRGDVALRMRIIRQLIERYLYQTSDGDGQALIRSAMRSTAAGIKEMVQERKVSRILDLTSNSCTSAAYDAISTQTNYDDAQAYVNSELNSSAVVESATDGSGDDESEYDPSELFDICGEGAISQKEAAKVQSKRQIQEAILFLEGQLSKVGDDFKNLKDMSGSVWEMLVQKDSKVSSQLAMKKRVLDGMLTEKRSMKW